MTERGDTEYLLSSPTNAALLLESAHAAFVAGVDEALKRDMAIGEELYHIFRRLGATSALLATVGSWTEGDLSAEEFLAYLKAYNGADREVSAQDGYVAGREHAA